jgi:L-lactate utilization protein LutB
MTLLGCEDVCPKKLPLQSKIAYMRRQMVKTGLNENVTKCNCLQHEEKMPEH